MFQFTWQAFSNQPHIARLPINEQTRLYRLEEQRYRERIEYYSRMFVHGGGDSGVGTLPNVITSPTTIAGSNRNGFWQFNFKRYINVATRFCSYNKWWFCY